MQCVREESHTLGSGEHACQFGPKEAVLLALGIFASFCFSSTPGGLLTKFLIEIGEMAQRLRALTTLAEDPN